MLWLSFFLGCVFKKQIQEKVLPFILNNSESYSENTVHYRVKVRVIEFLEKELCWSFYCSTYPWLCATYFFSHEVWPFFVI